VLCLWAVMSPINMICGNAFMSRGRVRTIFFLGAPQAVLLVAGSLVFAPDGIVAVSWVQAGIAIVSQAVTLSFAQRTFKLTTHSLLRAFVPPLLASAALAGVLVAVSQFINAPWPEIVSGAASGGLVYVALLYVLAPGLLPDIQRLLRARSGDARV